MFDIGWGEFVVIGTVALVVIGPKELPGVLRTVGKTVGKLRRMAGEFQGQFQEALREADLDETRKTMSGLSDSASSFNPIQTIRDEIKNAVDAKDGGSGVTMSGTAATPVADTPSIALPEPPPVPDLTPEQIRAAFVTEPNAFEDMPSDPAPEPAPEKPKRTRRKPAAEAGSVSDEVIATAPDTAENPAPPKRRARKTKAAAAGEPADGGDSV